MERPLHDRMPVILDGCDRDAWLAPAAEPAHLKQLLRPYPVGLMEAVEVSPLVNNPRNDGPNLLQPTSRPGTGPR